MKIRNVVFLLIVVLLGSVFMGCDALSEAFDTVLLNADDVEAGDLADYSAAGGEAGTEAEVEQGFELAMSALNSQSAARRILGDDYSEIVNVLRMSSPEMAAIIGPETPESRAASASASANISDETFTEGAMTITVTNLDVSGDVDVNSLDNPTEVKAKFDAKAEIGMSDITETVTYNYNPVDVTIRDMKFNFNGNGNSTITLTAEGTVSTVNYYIGLDVALGFSLETADCSGKYIVNVKYINSAEVTAASPDFTGGETLNVIIIAYDNSGTELARKTYTAEQFIGAVGGMM